jgi:hypothetical protein
MILLLEKRAVPRVVTGSPGSRTSLFQPAMLQGILDYWLGRIAMPGSLIPFVALLLLLLPLSSAAAQEARPAPVADPTAPAAIRPDTLPRSLAKRGAPGVASVVGGIIVGGWVGYVAAQVDHSDWAKSSNSELRGERVGWVAAGAVAGAVAVWLVPGLASRQPAVRPTLATPASHFVLTEAELRASHSLTALEVIQLLRSDWLVLRGTRSWRETPGGNVTGMRERLVVAPGDPTIIVYVDGLRLGGVPNLAEIQLESVTRIEFLDASAASVRFGGGHAHGAILVSTRASAP